MKRLNQLIYSCFCLFVICMSCYTVPDNSPKLFENDSYLSLSKTILYRYSVRSNVKNYERIRSYCSITTYPLDSGKIFIKVQSSDDTITGILQISNDRQGALFLNWFDKSSDGSFLFSPSLTDKYLCFFDGNLEFSCIKHYSDSSYSYWILLSNDTIVPKHFVNCKWRKGLGLVEYKSWNSDSTIWSDIKLISASTLK